ncbi:hypothetical protein Pth03_16930 [Planotetraspora thailandica]|uniref:SIS domain-containing protein n=1 Tax=Planotetraspora thailandica TaxID=487172 RepID=A0A8J3UWG4_9ACTN|nr:SIS domain-containing protein [Planotetraspora thailandica]GII53304.1 hypothetical protein Pth03_16930 [Planotetraspora thailandica]
MTDAGGPGMTFDPDRLDDQAHLTEGDPTGVLPAVASSMAHVRTARRAAVEADVARLTRFGRPRAIVVAGMGGSVIAGDVLAAVCGNGAPLPIVTAGGDRLPGWVGAADVVIAVSRSGDTPETLGLAAEAVRRGCSTMGVGRADSPLETVLARGGGPYVRLAGEAQTGTLWETAVPLVVAASSLGLADADDDAFEAAAGRLEDIAHRCRPSSESFINPGKTLATELAGSIPMIWGTSPLAVAAARWTAFRLNEIAKYPAIWGALPDNLHQGAAFAGPLAGRDIFADPFDDEPGEGVRLRLVVLRDAEEHERAPGRRAEAMRLAEERGVPVSEIVAEGAHPLERLATLIGLCDYGSAYLALGYGVDPAPLSEITELKARISP